MQSVYERSREEAEQRMGRSQEEMVNVAREVVKLQEQLKVGRVRAVRPCDLCCMVPKLL